jgi:hypothetical protein
VLWGSTGHNSSSDADWKKFFDVLEGEDQWKRELSLNRSVHGSFCVGTASRVPRVTLALACSEGLYTLSHPVASSLIHIQHQPEHYIYL